MKQVAESLCFGGRQLVFTHESDVLKCTMRFGVYLPPQAADGPCPVLYWLSGLTCTEENFITKAGAQAHAARHGLILVAPDTSPRGCGVPGEDKRWDLGTGASFYVNATRAPWSDHYRMHDYVVDELPALIEAEFPATDARSVAGHSMGGHGALIVALRNPGRYKSVSALAPVVALSSVPWGELALAEYLEDRAEWAQWDACELVAGASERLPILIDQGDADMFLKMQLRPELLEEACAKAGHPLTLRRHAGYDHGFYFIASFVGDHIDHHAAALLG